MWNSAITGTGSIERRVPAGEENDRGNVAVEDGGFREREPEDMQQRRVGKRGYLSRSRVGLWDSRSRSPDERPGSVTGMTLERLMAGSRRRVPEPDRLWVLRQISLAPHSCVPTEFRRLEKSQVFWNHFGPVKIVQRPH
jgi:hypothetical protein